MEEDVTLGGGCTVQYTRHESWKCTLETYMILLINVTSINLIKNNEKLINKIIKARVKIKKKCTIKKI